MNKFFANTEDGLITVSPDTPIESDICAHRMAKNIIEGVYSTRLLYPATIDHIGYLIEKLNKFMRVDNDYMKDIKAITNYKQALHDLNWHISRVEPDYAGMATLSPNGEITLGVPSDGCDVEVLSTREMLDKLLCDGASVPIVYSSQELDSLVYDIDCEVSNLCEVLQHTYDEDLVHKIKCTITHMTTIRNGVLFGLASVNREIYKVRYPTH